MPPPALPHEDKMDPDTLAKLRWAYSYLCFPREALLLGKLQQQIEERAARNSGHP